MQNYSKKWFGRRKLYKECLNYLDQYKACIVGINHDKMLSAMKKELSEDELYQKRLNAMRKSDIGEDKQLSEKEQVKVKF